MLKPIFGTMLAVAAAFALLSGCDKATSPSTSGGGTDLPIRIDSTSAAGIWSRTVGSALETVTLGADGKATMDSLTVTGSVSRGARYTGTWSGTASSFSVTWSGYATTDDGSTWSALQTLPSMTPYPFTVSGSTASVVVGGATRTYTKGAGTMPTADLVVPVITPGGGTFPATQGVLISSPTIGAEIHFTTDGSTPTTASSKYTGSIPVSATKTIKAIAVKDGKSSSVVSATIVIQPVEKPVDNTREPTLAGAWLNLNIATMAGLSYQLDSSGQAISVRSEGTGKPSYMYMGTWTASNGTLNIVWAVAMSSADGVTFSTNIPLPAPFQATYKIEESTLRLVSGGTTTAFQRATINNVPSLPKPTFSPDGGSYSSAQTVELTGPSGAKIHYTTDGSDPDESSPVYSAALSVSKTTTVKAIAILDDGESSIASAMFVITSGPVTRDPSVVGSWKSITDSITMSFVFQAGGTYSAEMSMSVPGITYFARQSGTWSTAQGMLTTIQLTSDMSQDGVAWMAEPDFTPETVVVKYSVSGNSLLIDEDGDAATFTKSSP
ncbi:MAG: chitobiase/beta-hexosaminidase C-terminal domain-containing protein [Fibrobacterota bacterium]|nr:chitobiase/beta-hexosaminidase C-terminal domain-containing protein [Fibrobacterota bacterium]QQS07215.1 MAG: chitobiase/beta-hexosaminidase C-terminal domain-containing protein [Fibrobacterota bacterium]